MNFWNSLGFGRVRLSRAPFVAHRGTGPETVSRTFHPRSTAPRTCGSYALQLYASGFDASKVGFTREDGSGATFCQSITMRIDRTPKLEISSKADVRVAGLARSTGASNVMDWLLEIGRASCRERVWSSGVGGVAVIMSASAPTS